MANSSNNHLMSTPFTDGDRNVRDTSALDPMMSNRPRVMVIDDDPLFRSLLASLLGNDYNVDVAGDGSEGFYKAIEQPPVIAVIDIQMPGWDGLKTLQAFRGHNALSEVKSIILTSDASKETVLAAIHGGADDYVIKTHFSKEDFLQKLKSLLPEEYQKVDSDTAHEMAPPPNGPLGQNSVPALNTGSANLPTTVVQSNLTGSCNHSDSPCEESALQELIDDWE